jgi:hypothetical protein
LLVVGKQENKMQKFKILEEMQAQETLFGLAYNERIEEKKWVFKTLTWEVLLWCFVAPNGQHLPFSGQNLQKISKQSLLEMLHNNQKTLENFC